jgi:hypothetical protein
MILDSKYLEIIFLLSAPFVSLKTIYNVNIDKRKKNNTIKGRAGLAY